MSLDRNATGQSIVSLSNSVQRVSDRAQLTISESRSVAARVVKRVTSELAARQTELARAEEALRRCLSQEDASCSTESARVRRAQTAVDIAQSCLSSATTTQSDLNARLASRSSEIAQATTQGREFLRARLHELDDYNALGGALIGGGQANSSTASGHQRGRTLAETGGSALLHPPGLPDGFAMVPLALIDRSQSTVHGPQDFKKGYSPDDLAWAFHAFQQVVLPGLAAGATADTFRARDHSAGFQGTHSYAMTHSQFLSSGDSIRLNPQSGGTYAIANGQHRVWVAQQYGISHVPARIV